MTLRDDAFLREVPVADEPRPDFKSALRGVGDPMAREGFWDGFKGVPVPPEQDELFKVGDVVEYETPDKVQRVGSLLRPYDDVNWLVQVDEGEQHIVPLVELRPSVKTPRHARRAAAQAALRRTSSWTMRRGYEERPDGTVLLTVDTGHAKASENEIRAFAAQHGFRAVDAAQEHNLLRIVAQAMDSPPENQEPGIETEELESVAAPYDSGTGPQSIREDYPGGFTDGDYVVEAADEKAKSYFKDYYGPYGEKLTREAQEKRTINTLPRPNIIERDQRPVGGNVSVADITKTVAAAAAARPEYQKVVDKALRGALQRAQNPKALLDSLGDTTYMKLIARVVQGSDPRGQRALFKVFRRYSEEGGRQFSDPDLGPQRPQQPQQQPQPQPQSQPQVSVQDAAAYVDRVAPGTQGKERQEYIKQVMDDPPADLKKSAQRQKPLGHQVRPMLEKVTAQGQYLCIDVVWDPEETEGMSPGGIRHNVITWLKGLATLKEQHPDLGTLGKPRFKLFDPEAGLARILVRSSEGRSFPQEFAEVEGADNDTRA